MMLHLSPPSGRQRGKVRTRASSIDVRPSIRHFDSDAATFHSRSDPLDDAVSQACHPCDDSWYDHTVAADKIAAGTPYIQERACTPSVSDGALAMRFRTLERCVFRVVPIDEIGWSRFRGNRAELV